MEQINTYKSSDRMIDLITDNHLLLMVMSRFGISLGFGDKTVEDICKSQEVDCDTFLVVANFVSGKRYNAAAISLPSFISYLKNAHTFYIDFCLPLIRRKLLEAIDCSSTNEIAFLIVKFYDEYALEVRRHMEYENNTVFVYVENMLKGNRNSRYSIRIFESQHNNIDAKLKELKNLIVRYYPEKENNLLNAVLFDLINCEQDLISHCHLEDRLFVPAVERLEEQIACNTGNNSASTDSASHATDSEKIGVLSAREKEIIVCVAKGLSNKEIANTLNLSVHTITTHRRNICSKLQIHTPAGLTIFAIANKLVRLNDIKIS